MDSQATGPENTSFVVGAQVGDIREPLSMFRSAGWETPVIAKEIESSRRHLAALTETIKVPHRLNDPERRYIQAVALLALVGVKTGQEEGRLPVVTAPTVVIDRIVVPFSERRKGYGTKLLGRITTFADQLRNPRYKTVIANTRGRYGRAFFEANGFTPNPEDPESPFWSRPLRGR